VSVDTDKLLAEFKSMGDALRRAAQGSSSDPLSRRRGHEANYARAYQRLVSAGAAPQIRMKYR
jgi:hypothetical protein